MHYLHPRSRTTGTLFTTTLAVSFLVVALPHFLPCPVDHRQHAETIEMPDGTIKRRRQRRTSINPDAVEGVEENEALATLGEHKPNKCPVPKPGGLVGQIMGFDQRRQEKGPECVVESLKSRTLREGGRKEEG
ncbi:hypothetical protein M433DRAFT_74318 [Acidomyces richmondensis BFW]|nr:hypothetical protein M433DRAFT_74318 [Acidomyces richmondensis BFW]